MPNNRSEENGRHGESRVANTGTGLETISAPSISLPKGGGAIRGIGEKFAANPVTGTGSLTIPIATSPGRSGFGPQLTLSYDSGAGNGPFGLGWDLALPSITRKTNKGLPKYMDAEESDEFILSGAEDLVPVLVESGGEWVREVLPPRVADGQTYTVQRYRPRIEGLFARIERWTNQAHPAETFWRSISKNNVTTWYGKTAESRIADPTDPRRVFSWMICESHDDKGNVIVYQYKEEDSEGVDLSQAHERNRTPETRSTNRYLKRIKYGNRTPYFPVLDEVQPPSPLPGEWLFEAVFDYGEHDADVPLPAASGSRPSRKDPFSSYRAGFEVRTYRLCQRVLMFHHFPEEDGVGSDCLVRSTDFTYSHEEDPTSTRNPVFSFMKSVTQAGYKRSGSRYLKKLLPPVEFDYSQPEIQEEVREADAESLENLPFGLGGAQYQWVDLDGEGLSGILIEQADGWFYKRNMSPITTERGTRPETMAASFAPLERVAQKPSLGALSSGRQQLLDLAGDGQLDLVQFFGPANGFHERTQDENWEPFRSFESFPNLDWTNPNLRFVDLTGDGHADVLITEHEAFTWYPSLGEKGFLPGERIHQALDEEKGPRLVFADGSESVYLSDMSGDGLTDLVRIRNGEVCYWPNLGYGRFGARITMDNAPFFDTPDQFDQNRIRLADIDGSGVTDIIYLNRDGVRIYFNQSGNSWSQGQQLAAFPDVDNLSEVAAVDLLGTGTACLVWSSPLPGDSRRQMRYVDLMGGQKPHLLLKTANNLGAETRVRYAPSTRFYLQDKREGRPWVTRLPFPVHVVERVETYDHISRNRFVTRYAHHHGYFDGEEREFRGFGMVEQWDTEEFAALRDDSALPEASNLDPASHVPPVLTRTWFHTGVHIGRHHVSDFFAGLLDAADRGEYYREPGLTDAQARELLLDDTVLPDRLTAQEEHEACRALKGLMLRLEVYGLDATPKAEHPYTVTEQNFTIRQMQPRGGNRHAVFFTHPRETISRQYDRNPADPRTAHAMTLEVDSYGNVSKQVAIGYARRQPDPALPLDSDRDKQTKTLITYTETGLTNANDDPILSRDYYRAPLPAETRTYELTGFTPTGAAGRFTQVDFVEPDPDAPEHLVNVVDREIHYEDAPTDGRERRLIEQVRTLYRPDDLGEAQNDPLALLPLGTLQPLALPGEVYRLAFTPGLLAQVFQRDGEALLPDPTNVLGGEGLDRGGFLASQQLKADGRFPDTDPEDHWWIPAGRIFLSPNTNDTAAQELANARLHFYLRRRYRDPFHTVEVNTESIVTYDNYDLLMLEGRDPLGNRVTAGQRLASGELDATIPGNDYRVLQPRLVMDPNRNRSAVTFDALGMVVGTAAMGKPEEIVGDSLDGFNADLADADILDHLANPFGNPHMILGRATSRLVYDLFSFHRTRNDAEPQPGVVYTLVRETHDADLEPGQQTRVQHSFSYSDGFGREIQKKIQAEPERINGVTGPSRWVGSGWTVFNNKGKPVRQYEPFFSATNRFEFGAQVGVSPILFYDPVERVIATLHPNHTYEKVVFDPWRQITYDVNDTVAPQGAETGDPRTDSNIRGYVAPYFATQPDAWQTWHAQRQGGAMGVDEEIAAAKAASHANTPTTVYLDALGRPFLTLDHNRFTRDGATVDETPSSRVELDVEGNQRVVRDAVQQNGDMQGRIVMRYDYDMLGNRIHQASMEAGRRWMVNDVAGKPIRAWDSRGHVFRTDYDSLRRPLRIFVTGADPENPSEELLTERLVYGEQHPEDELNNLRGGIYLRLDQAGAVSSETFDFKGNLLRASRRLAREYRQAIDWSAVDAVLPDNGAANLDPASLEAALAPLLETDTFTSLTTYDAIDRPVRMTTPHTAAMQPSIIRNGYNEANFLERVDANLRGATVDGQPVWTPFVTNIDYDAKWQRLRVDYGNGASTFYQYDPLTFRLVHLATLRNAVAFPDDCPEPPPAGWPGCQVQSLRYTYDPIGNITRIRDDAQQTIYFRNRRVEPSAEYTYDALYRLIEATGREHLGQTDGLRNPPTPPDAFNTFHTRLDHPGDGNAMGTYIERYMYDAVGNILEMQHRGSDPAHAGWTRRYTYSEPSLLEPVKQSNRLSTTTVGNGDPVTERYVYDAQGNMTRMPHLGGAHPAPNLHWDYRDQLQRADLGGGGAAYFVYDASGQRARKAWEKSASLIEERIYLGVFEIFRRRNGAGTITLERETLHVMDESQRIALVETRTVDTAGSDPALQQLTRYQFGNHLGSTILELDDNGQIISYEEYTPYGSTSYQAVRSRIETPRRYRYTAMERDEETGLNYHDARYYAPLLARWCSTDPAGLAGGLNVYEFAYDNPLIFRDTSGGQPTAGRYPDLWFRTNLLEARQIGDESDYRRVRTPEGIRFVRIPSDPEGRAELERRIPEFEEEAFESEARARVGLETVANSLTFGVYGLTRQLSEADYSGAALTVFGMTGVGMAVMPLISGGGGGELTSDDPTVRGRARGSIQGEVLGVVVPAVGLGIGLRGPSGEPTGVGRSSPERTPTSSARVRRSAATPARPTSEITTLTNVQAEIAAADVLPQYTPGSGFSGVYNPATDQWVALASGENTRLLSGRPVSTVPQFGGHANAEAVLVQRTGISDVSGNVGFVLIKGEGTTLRIRWNSGQINARNFGNPAAPLEYRAAIREAVRRVTGFEVLE